MNTLNHIRTNTMTPYWHKLKTIFKLLRNFKLRPICLLLTSLTSTIEGEKFEFLKKSKTRQGLLSSSDVTN